MESWKLPQLIEQVRELRYSVHPDKKKLMSKLNKEIKRIEYEKVEEEFLARHARPIPPSHWGKDTPKMRAEAEEFVPYGGRRRKLLRGGIMLEDYPEEFNLMLQEFDFRNKSIDNNRNISQKERVRQSRELWNSLYANSVNAIQQGLANQAAVVEHQNPLHPERYRGEPVGVADTEDAGCFGKKCPKLPRLPSPSAEAVNLGCRAGMAVADCLFGGKKPIRRKLCRKCGLPKAH